MPESNSYPEIVAQLAEEFIARHRAGQRPTLAEYTRKFPEHAEAIRRLFPAMVMMEQIAVTDDGEAKAAAPLSAGEQVSRLSCLGDYRIIREIGRGGMGIVYEAEQVSLGRPVALKVLPQHAISDQKNWARFEREARTAAQLHHTNIVPVFGVGESDGIRFYAMQYIQGLGLERVLEDVKRLRSDPAVAEDEPALPEHRSPNQLGDRDCRDVSAANMARSLVSGQVAATATQFQINASEYDQEATSVESVDSAAQASRSRETATNLDTGHVSGSAVLPEHIPTTGQSQAGTTYWRSVARVGVQIADALQYAHKSGVLHRDVKPSNVLLDLKGTAWLTDFGLAKAEDEQNLTRTGDVLGTLRYMAPECFTGSADARSDVYSLGLTLYEMLILKPAFGEHDHRMLVSQIMQQTPPSLRSVAPRMPRDLETVIHKAIEREPARRYQTAAELRDDLQRFLDDQPIHARRTSLVERFVRWSRRHKGVAASLAVIGFLLVVGLISSLIGMEYYRIKEKEARAIALRLQKAQVANTQLKRAQESVYRLRELVDQFAVGLGDQLADQPELEAAMCHTVGRAYWRLGLLEQAEQQILRALDLREQLFGKDHATYAESLIAYAWVLNERGEEETRTGDRQKALTYNAAAQKTAQQAVAILKSDHNSPRLLIAALRVLQQGLLLQENYAESEKVGHEALKIAEAQDERYPETADVLQGLAEAARRQSRFEQGEQLARRAIELRRALGHELHFEMGSSLAVLADCLRAQQKYDEARETHQQALVIFRRSVDESHFYAHLFGGALAHLDQIAGPDARPAAPEFGTRNSYKQIQRHCRTGDWERAVELFEQWRSTDDTAAPACFQSPWWVNGPYPGPFAKSHRPEKQLDALLAPFHVSREHAEQTPLPRVRGRYVRIQLPDGPRPLTLAEVQVFDGMHNLARDGSATQSSTAHGGTPDKAIDGSMDGVFWGGSSSHTQESDRSAWWELDLAAMRDMDRIVVWNRSGNWDSDQRYASRLNGMRLTVLDEDRRQVWADAVHDATARLTTFVFDPDRKHVAGVLPRSIWQDTHVRPNRALEFASLFPGGDGAVYAATRLFAANERPLWIYTESGRPAQVWLNRASTSEAPSYGLAEAGSEEGPEDSPPHQTRVLITTLQPGWNHVLVKLELVRDSQPTRLWVEFAP